MNFDDYMRKIQNISNILEKNNYAENILNSKDLDIEKDFQYICLSSASNYNLVNEVIARLAQNGNKNIVEDNIKNISMNMWKDLFDKNEAIKKIFIDNFNVIFENTIILTFREIERFINDTETCKLIYNTLDGIIRKLCTYDRASLILVLKNSEEGIQKIKENLEVFFQKGDFDISTTYSKIVIELGNISEINKIDILKACNKNLSEMLDRETAIDNETNKLLNWIYDTYEETQMSESEKVSIKQNINSAILANFDNILDKANYDKHTIKILKQFDCTKEKFEKNKSHLAEKLNNSNRENEIYSINNERKYLFEHIVNSKKINDILTNTTNQINKENVLLKNIINEKSNIEELQDNTNSIANEERIMDNDNLNNIHDTTNNENYEKIQVINNEKNAKISNVIEKKELNTSSDNLINAYIEEFNQREKNKKLEENIDKSKDEILDNQIKKLIETNIEETDQIIDKVLKRNTQTKEQDFNIEQIEAKIISNQLKNNKEIDTNTSNNSSNTNTSLIVKEEGLENLKKVNLFKRIWKKIISIFKSRSTIERIGE